jgi:hypothetical protein
LAKFFEGDLGNLSETVTIENIGDGVAHIEHEEPKAAVLLVGAGTLFVSHSGHSPHFVGCALPARGDYCKVAKKSGANTISKKHELICRKPLTEPPRHREKFSTGTPTSSSA